LPTIRSGRAAFLSGDEVSTVSYATVAEGLAVGVVDRSFAAFHARREPFLVGNLTTTEAAACRVTDDGPGAGLVLPDDG